jgi:hypothetical protein
MGSLKEERFSTVKREVVILKLYFEKAFDLVEHEVILSMFKHKVFSEKWVT